MANGDGFQELPQPHFSYDLEKDIVVSEEQVVAILSVLSGRDTIAYLPTGQGKSVMFKILPWCYSFAGSMEPT